MKNKTLISVCINLLIGVIFSFPAFSGQANADSFVNAGQEYQFVTVDFISGSMDSDIYMCESELFNEDKQIKLFKQTLIKKKYFSGSNKDKSELFGTGSDFCTFYLYNSKSNCNNLFSTFVNLSYLKDLRNTKMLC